MKTKLLLLTLATGLLAGQLFAQDAKKTAAPKQPKAAAPASTDKPKPAMTELEAKFKATMTKAVMAGRWCSVTDGQLGPDKDDKYTIVGVTKLGGSDWAIHARIQYGRQDVTVPIPVKVRWAGDTPVIVVEGFAIPGGGTYSARVLIYEGTYAGTWSGGDHGGLLNGVITKQKE
ncbi:MAG: hypothetical protein HZA89_05520 [Verrucomicrobia bacterium]|nr:hypothetical protein [Verrucomicrobiota bacterium]